LFIKTERKVGTSEREKAAEDRSKGIEQINKDIDESGKRQRDYRQRRIIYLPAPRKYFVLELGGSTPKERGRERERERETRRQGQGQRQRQTQLLYSCSTLKKGYSTIRT